MDDAHRPGVTDQAVEVPAPPETLRGTLSVPPQAKGVVLCAYAGAAGSHRLAQALQGVGLATLLLDLLTGAEGASDVQAGRLRFDVGLLTGRLVAATAWLSKQAALQRLPVGYFGTSTSATAALVAATELPGSIGAIVSQGGWPDLAGPALSWVRVPTLLIVGAQDEVALELNRRALNELAGEKELAVVKSTGRQFESPEALAELERLACAWFQRFLRAA